MTITGKESITMQIECWMMQVWNYVVPKLAACSTLEFSL